MLEPADAMLQPAEPILREVGLQMQKWEVRCIKAEAKEKVEGKSNPDDEDERKLKRQRRRNPTGNLLIDPDCASRPLARCKEACHDKTVSQTCCNQEHDGSRSEQHALRTRDLPDIRLSDYSGEIYCNENMMVKDPSNMPENSSSIPQE
ncbi:hypothetical protein Tco_0517063 [Tanacetum coccineum]